MIREFAAAAVLMVIGASFATAVVAGEQAEAAQPAAERGEQAPEQERDAQVPQSLASALQTAADEKAQVYVYIIWREDPILGQVLSVRTDLDHVALRRSGATYHVRLSQISFVEVMDEESEVSASDEPRAADPAAEPTANAAERLYLGKPQSFWQRTFDAERNPLARFEAAEALVHLADELEPDARVARFVEIGGKLVEHGWGEKHAELPLNSIGRKPGKNVLDPARWQWSEELAKGWMKLVQLMITKMQLVPGQALATGLAQAVQNGSPQESSFVASLVIRVGQSSILDHLRDDPAAIEILFRAIRAGAEETDEQGRLLKLVRSTLFFWGGKEHQPQTQAVLAELTKELAGIAGDPASDVWLYAWENQASRLDGSAVGPAASLTLQWILRDRAVASRLFEAVHSYKLEEFHGTHFRNRTKHFLNGWIETVNAWLKEHPEAELNQRQVVLRTLDPTLRHRTGEDQWNVAETAELLADALREFYSDPGTEPTTERWDEILPASPARLLTLILLAGGELPEYAQDGFPPSAEDRKRLALFSRAISSNLSREDYEREAKKFEGIAEVAPYLVVKAALEAEGLPEQYGVPAAIASAAVSDVNVSTQGGGNYSEPAIDPLLLLAIGADLVRQPQFEDDRVARLFGLISEEAGEALKSSLAVEATMRGLLEQMYRETDSEPLRAAILNLAPDLQDNVAN